MLGESDEVEFLWPYPKGDETKVARMVYAIGALGRWYAQQKAGTDALTNLIEKPRFIQVCRRFGYHFNLTEECADFSNIQQVLIKLRKQGHSPCATASSLVFPVRHGGTSQRPKRWNAYLSRVNPTRMWGRNDSSYDRKGKRLRRTGVRG